MRLISLPHAGTVVLWQLSQRLLLSRQVWIQENSGNNWTDCIISKLPSTAEASTHPLRTFRSWPWYLLAEKDTPILWYWKTSIGCGRSKADPPAKPSSEAHPLTLPSLSREDPRMGGWKHSWNHENTTTGIIAGSGEFSITSTLKFFLQRSVNLILI